MPRAWPENGATSLSMVSVFSTLFVILSRVVTALLSLEIKLTVLSLAWAAMYLLQRLLVGKRRCSGHWLVQYGAMAAYYLPTGIALYAARAVSYSSTSNISESTIFLVVGVLFMLMITIFVPTQAGVLLTNMRAYSLRYRPQDRSKFVMGLVFLGCVDWEWAQIPSANQRGRREYLNIVGLMVAHFLVAFMILVAKTSESTLDCQTKAVADYMDQLKSSKSSTGSPSPSPFFDDDDDANSNSSLCMYPFAKGTNGEWFTFKDLVQRDDLPNEDKYIWLSYILSRLLARRYFGFPCAEEGDVKVRRLALAGLGTTDGSYKKAFKTVEVQLAFLHDYFFTASIKIVQTGSLYIEATLAPVLIIAFALATACFTISIPEFDGLRTIHMLVGVMVIMFGSWCGVFGLPFQHILAMYWRPIRNAFLKLDYLPDDDIPTGRLMTFFRSIPTRSTQDVFDPFQSQTDGVYWRNKIGQYSILQDYDRRLSLKKELVYWFQIIMLSEPSYRFIHHFPVEEEEVDIQKLDSMREFVAGTLQAIDGPPTNGSRSLKINMDEINKYSVGYDWLSTCKQKTHTDTILIWHIGTCYCDMIPISTEDLLVKRHHEAARALSRYCAYLVAFLPEFLPELSLTTKQVFQGVMQEAKQELATQPMNEEEKLTRIQELELPHTHEQTTFQKGVHLGWELEKLKEEVRWKVMAEFWAETILYAAPSDNAEAHVEHLAKGGEFITHLWAMLSNAGILKRAPGEWHPPASTTTEGPATQQLTEALSSSIDEASTSSMSFLLRETSEPPTNKKGNEPQILDDID